jgi:ubiquinone/menaquinone biosynthesis C-methylase UbiE
MRVYDQNLDLDYTATRRFFEQRGEKLAQVGSLGAVLYQDRQPELARRRSAHELECIAPKLKAGRPTQNILDLGCGTGRWTAALADVAQHYVGLDFCEEFLNEARRATPQLAASQSVRYEHADLSQGLPTSVQPMAFDSIIVAGVLLYLNDADAHTLLQQMAERLNPQGLLYIREPLGVTQRLTLKAHYSDDLNAEYSSVYRSLDEFRVMLDAAAQRHGLTLCETDGLYPPELDNRSDTRQHYFLLEKKSAS